MTILEIKKIFSESDISEYEDLIMKFSDDDRVSVKKLLNSYSNKYKIFFQKLERINKMAGFDLSYGDIVVGVDEAGRGPLFGSVFAAACIIKPCKKLHEVYDSKTLSESKREFLYDLILENSIAYGIASSSADFIDKYGIQKAVSVAMKKSLEIVDKKLQERGMTRSQILVDFVSFEIEGFSFLPIVKGDQNSFAIACASILAKVSRDRLIKKLDKKYPEYGLISHKGYGTQQHIDALKNYGITDEHRKTFLKGILKDK